MKIYTAAVESTKSSVFPRGIEPNVYRNVFWSYYYSRTKDRTQFLLDLYPSVETLVVDSGAHSFFTEHDALLATSGLPKKKKEDNDPDLYFKGFLAWLDIVYESIDYYIELDIGELVGQEKILQWRKILQERGFWDKGIAVYHPKVVSWDNYLMALDSVHSRYIAVEGDRVYRKTLYYMPIIKEAYNRGIKIHGFALTKPEVLNRYPFYSTDSTSWKNGPRYGRLPIWQDDRLTHLAMKRSGRGSGITDNVRKKLGQEAILNKAIGGILPSDASSRTNRFRYSIKTYRAMEEHYTKLWLKRGIDWEAKIDAHT